jgi:hypothetical protein
MMKFWDFIRLVSRPLWWYINSASSNWDSKQQKATKALTKNFDRDKIGIGAAREEEQQRSLKTEQSCGLRMDFF